MAPSKNFLNLKKYLKLPSGDLFLTIVIVISYLLTRGTYENQSKSKIGKNIISRINKRTGLKFQMPSDLTLFKMNNHYKRADKKISDVLFICLLAFFVFKMKWNNTDSFTNEQKLAWVSSVLISPLIINIFLENKNKVSINPERVSNLKEMKKSNNQTKVFLIFSILLTIAVVVKLAHRIIVCKGGIEKPIIIQMIIIGTTIGLHFLANKDKKENFGSGTEDSLSELFEELFKNKHGNIKYQWKERDKFLKKIKKEDFKTYDEILKGFDTFRLNQFKIDLEKRRKRVNEYFKDQKSADNRFTDPKNVLVEKMLAYKVINLEAEADWPKLWKASGFRYKDMELWFEQGYWEKYEKEGRPYPGLVVRLFKHFFMNNDGSIIKLSKDTVPSEDVRKKWIFTLVMGGLFNFLSKDIILKSTEFNTYDKIKGNFKYLYYYTHIVRAYHDKIDYQQPMDFLIKKFDPSQPVDKVYNFYKNKIKPNHHDYEYKNQLPFTQRLVYDIHKKSGLFSNDEYYFKKHRIPSDYTPKIESYKQLMYHANKLHEEFLKKYPTEPTLEEVKKHESVKYTYYCEPFKYSEKDKFIKFYMKPENKSLYKETSFRKDGKQKMNKSWVIAFLLILSFTVCRKDTIDYIIEGSLWGYLIQNIARWDDISPDLM